MGKTCSPTAFLVVLLVLLHCILPGIVAYGDTDDLWNPDSSYNETGFTNVTVYKPTDFVKSFHAVPHIGRYSLKLCHYSLLNTLPCTLETLMNPTSSILVELR